MIEKDTWAYWQGKHSFSLKTPLAPKEVRSVLQSVVGSISQPTGDELEPTMTRYYGAVQRDSFWLRKTLVKSRQEPIFIEGQYKEKGAGTSLDITMSGTTRHLTIVGILFFLTVSIVVLSSEPSYYWLFLVWVLGSSIFAWAYSMKEIWQQVEIEMTFLLKLLDEAEATLVSKAVYEDDQTTV